MDERLHSDTFWSRLEDALDQVDEAVRTPPPDGRVGAVLVLLEDTAQGPQVVLTRRRRDMRSHPGQISFAGGRVDEDETVVEAALREAEEEIGLDAASVEILGTGPTFFIPPSRFWVAPVLARWVRPHDLDPNPWEVDAVLRVPLSYLLDSDRWRHVPLSARGSSWAWQLDDGDLLWGATALVMALLLDVAVRGWNEGVQPHDLPDEAAARPWESLPEVVRQARLDGDLPTIAQDDVPHVTAAQMRRMDELLLASGVGLASLVEQAGRAVAHAVRRLIGTRLGDVRVTVLAGPGGNGAGGLAAARLLLAGGADVDVVLTGDVRLPEQLRVLEAAGVRIQPVTAGGLGDHAPGNVVVDAMLGYGAEPPLRDGPEKVTEWLRRHDVPVVSLDLPSGIHADRGLSGPPVGADVTVTLAAPKVALRQTIVQPYVGDLYLADIGVPPRLWEQIGIDPILFELGPLVRLTSSRTTDAGTPDQQDHSPG